MPRAYPAEFRQRAVALVRARPRRISGSPIRASYTWVRQDRIDRGEIPGATTAESRELRRARRRIRELESEVEILRRANTMLGDEARRPKGFTR